MNKNVCFVAADYFNGEKISEYGLKHGYVDYRTFTKNMEMVLNNDLMFTLENNGYYFEPVNGFDSDYDDDENENEEYEYPEIYQYFIVDDQAAEMIKDYTNDPLFYCETLDLYIYGITHYGTSWDYVLTDIPCNVGYDFLDK